jgi:hypothetical protein
MPTVTPGIILQVLNWGLLRRFTAIRFKGSPRANAVQFHALARIDRNYEHDRWKTLQQRGPERQSRRAVAWTLPLPSRLINGEADGMEIVQRRGGVAICKVLS